jgi:hypothetical protein
MVTVGATLCLLSLGAFAFAYAERAGGVLGRFVATVAVLDLIALLAWGWTHA